MNCREVSRMLAENTFDEGPAWRRLLARLHLLICRYCRRYRLQLRLMSRAAAAWADRLPDPARLAALEERLLQDYTIKKPDA
jgi:hypothetical protein